MPDPTTLAAVLLVGGPVLGLASVAHPALIPIWSMPREAFISTVGAHRRAWALLNAGFATATVATAAGLLVLGWAEDGDPGRGAVILLAALAYALGGVLWCAVLGARTMTTPLLADRLAAGEPTEPAESLLGAATGGLFAAFVLITAVALVVLGLGLLAGGGVAAPVAGSALVIGALALGIQLATGDVIPALLYLPTLLIGVALLAGWT